MTEIKIKKLILENFKCHRHLDLVLDGENAAVYGDNATGKTSIYDGLTWLLFGKDSLGNGEKNIEIKPLDRDGETADHDALTSVTAVLVVNGEETCLKRTYREVWSTKRGSSVATYDGNTSEYYIDGVPMKCSLYTERVAELIPEEMFRMLTSVSHFAAGISWKERRAVLFDIARVNDDRQILDTDSRFAPLLESMGRGSLEDLKKKLLSEKKGFIGAKTEIPARISECQKTVDGISGLDFAGARREAERLQAELDSIGTQILAHQHSAAADSKRLEIREAKLALDAIENENRAHRAAQKPTGPDVHGLQIRMTALEVRRKNLEACASSESSYILTNERKIREAREKWMRVNGEGSGVSTVCPTCGQALPADQVQKAMANAEAAKQNRLKEILANADDLKQAKAQAEARKNAMEEELRQVQAEMEALAREIGEAEKLSSEFVVTDLPDYGKKKEAAASVLRALEEQLADMMMDSNSVLSSLEDKKAELNGMLTQQQILLNRESLLDYSRIRIESLREDARNAAQALEAIEKLLFLMDEFSRYKTGFVEDSINGMFRLAKFRLFREQANGGVEDRCDVVYEGVPYGSVNNGMKINLGIDIINTLSGAYGVRVPLFVDNAEAVTNMEKCGSQIIRLVVSEEDKELRVAYEN